MTNANLLKNIYLMCLSSLIFIFFYIEQDNNKKYNVPIV